MSSLSRSNSLAFSATFACMGIVTLGTALLFLPTHAFAVGEPLIYEVGRSVLVATSTSGNLLLIGGSVAATASTGGDLTVLGGSVISAAPVAKDAFLVGGSVTVEAPIGEDLRVSGGRVRLLEKVTGDLVAFGGSVTDTGGGARSVLVIAGEASLLRGANGAATVYGNTVTLGGLFKGDVRVIATGKVVLEENTVIRGALQYQAPEAAVIPDSAVIEDGAHYTGASYLPTSEQAHAIALASFGIFLLVKILGALILAGLLTGLFPHLAERIANRPRTSSLHELLLTLLLGFGVLVAVPVLVFLLLFTFVGIGLGVLLLTAYVLLLILALVFSAVILGKVFSRLIFKRVLIRWSDGVIGMLALVIFWSVPFVGPLAVGALTLYTLGTLVIIFYRFAFLSGDDPAR